MPEEGSLWKSRGELPRAAGMGPIVQHTQPNTCCVPGTGERQMNEKWYHVAVSWPLELGSKSQVEFAKSIHRT